MVRPDDIRYTLLTDGSSDRLLVHPINWLLEQHCSIPFTGAWADPSVFPEHSNELARRLPWTLDLYPCELLFVHRDAEREPRTHRVQEIKAAVAKCGLSVPVVCVVPVRMVEAWLLIEEAAIRRAAGNPNGRVALNLPALKRLEERPDPKTDLFDMLVQASELSGRRSKRFRQRELFRARQRVAELISSYEQLRQLPAFQAFENELRSVLNSHNW